MPEVQAPPLLPKSQPSFGRRHSTIIKLLGVGALVFGVADPPGNDYRRAEGAFATAQ